MVNKILEGLKNPYKAYRHLHYKLATTWYLRRYDHTEGYRRLMRYRINHFGPEQAVGGFDKGIGKLQFDFLRNKGLTPTNSLLDVGCGSLRGGEYYIDYLDAGNYTGMDISAEAIEAGINRIEGLVEEKDPSFVVNDDLKFNHDGLKESYDYAIAQSVFTHLPSEEIDECIGNIGKVVDNKFYATFSDEPTSSPKGFGYHPDVLVDMAEEHGHSAELISEDDFPHPRGQRMMELTIRQ